MFSLPQVISMALLKAAENGNVQARQMHAVFLHAIHTTQHVHLYHSNRALHSISRTAANQHNSPHSSPTSSKYPQVQIIYLSVD